MNTVPFLRCLVGPEEYAIEAGGINTVHRADRLRLNAGQEEPFAWLPAPGGEIPVYRLADRLRRPAGPPDGPGVLITFKGGDSRYAVLVDGVAGMLEAPRSALRDLPSLMDPGPFVGVIVTEGRPILCLRDDLLGPWPAGPRGGDRMPRVSFSENRRPGGAPQIVTVPLPGVYDSTRRLEAVFSVMQVIEVLRDSPVVPLALAPAFVLGLSVWRGRPTPVIDLAACLGLEMSPHLSCSRMLICRTASNQIIAVAAASSVRRGPAPAGLRLRPHAGPAATPYLLAAFEAEDCVLVVPDLDAIAGRCI